MSEFEDFDNPLNETDADEPQSMSLMGGIASGGALPGGEFAFGEGNESYIQFDQLNFTVNVPLPPTIWMMLAGLGLLGWRKYRTA